MFSKMSIKSSGIITISVLILALIAVSVVSIRGIKSIGGGLES